MKRYALRRNRKVFARVYCKIKNHIKNLEKFFMFFIYSDKLNSIPYKITKGNLN